MNPPVNDYAEIVEECKGCDYAYDSVVARKCICACFIFPHTQWWFGLDCPRATHTKNKEENQ